MAERGCWECTQGPIAEAESEFRQNHHQTTINPKNDGMVTRNGQIPGPFSDAGQKQVA